MWSRRKSQVAWRRPGPARDLRPAISGAFTLLEILLAIALMAMLGTVLISGAGAIFRTASHPAAEEVFWRTVTAARQLALTSERTVQLRFDARDGILTWTDGASTGTEALGTEASLQFLQPRQGNTVLLGGYLVEMTEIPLVKFYSDGTCDAFRVQIKTGDAPPHVLAIDPWTCAPRLEGKK
ncbi:MAG: hypothetical protein PHQ04_06070 [Opitutaceae bacterium]|nr:hypothetical protein [Opitutaceae bacterium]